MVVLILVLLSPIIIGLIFAFFYSKIKKSYIHLEYMINKINEIEDFVVQSEFHIYENSLYLIKFRYKNLRIEYYLSCEETDQESAIIIYSLLNDEKLLVLNQKFYGIPKFLIKGPWKNQYQEFSKLFFENEKNKLENFKKQYDKNYIAEKEDPNKIII